jgi:hypothetical protein
LVSIRTNPVFPIPQAIGALLALSMAAVPAAAQQAVQVPSGQAVDLNEVLVDDTQGETWVRFRFVAPQIARGGGTVTYETAVTDMEHLCRHMVIPYLSDFALDPSRIVISMSDRDVPFGEANPQATQYFEAYRLADDNCIWEAF